MRALLFLLLLLALATSPALAMPTVLHVEQVTGSDETGDGSQSSPFATPARAATAVRELRAATSTSSFEIIVEIGAGTYPPFALDASHSGLSPAAQTRFRGRSTDEARTVVSGGITIPSGRFRVNKTLSASAAAASGIAVYTAKLDGLLNVSLASVGAISAGGCVHGCSANMPAGLSLNGEPLHLARWPNVDAATGHNQYTHAGPACGAGCLSVPAKSPAASRVRDWAKEGGGWIHGYYEWDWADGYRSISGLNSGANGSTTLTLAPADVSPKANARWYAVNLTSELDAPGEYYLDMPGGLLHLIPPASTGSSPPAKWGPGPVLSIFDGGGTLGVVDISGTSHATIEDLHVVDGRNIGVRADSVVGAVIHNVTVERHGRNGIVVTNGTDTAVTHASVSDTGCGAIRAHGGAAASLVPGNVSVQFADVKRFALWKRTYEAGIHWAGVGNEYSDNVVAGGPHNCFLGGGNEADAGAAAGATLAGVDCLFARNTLDGCAYEAADTGAFYSCGQQGTAFVNPGNRIVNSTFRNIRNVVGTGVQSASVQAIYLDDQMSYWTITNNTFENCQVGSFIGGGRGNVVQHNSYVRCDTAQHLDDRGLNWQHGSCDCASACEPLSGCQCDTGAVKWMLTQAPAAKAWASRFPALVSVSADRLCQPTGNIISHNRFCQCGKFIDADAKSTESWNTTVSDNTEFTTC